MSRFIYTFLISVLLINISPLYAQWQWNSDHINQGNSLNNALDLLGEAHDNFRKIENPEYIEKPPHSHQTIKAALDDIKEMLNDDVVAQNEAFYQPALNQIIQKFNDRTSRVEYSVGELLIAKIQAGDKQAISQANQILLWGLLQTPPLFEPQLDQRYQNLIHLLEQVLDETH